MRARLFPSKFANLFHLFAAPVERFEIASNGGARLAELRDLRPGLGHHVFATGNDFGLARYFVCERLHPVETHFETL